MKLTLAHCVTQRRFVHKSDRIWSVVTKISKTERERMIEWGRGAGGGVGDVWESWVLDDPWRKHSPTLSWQLQRVGCKSQTSNLIHTHTHTRYRLCPTFFFLPSTHLLYTYHPLYHRWGHDVSCTTHPSSKKPQNTGILSSGNSERILDTHKPHTEKSPQKEVPPSC